jgi:hypothetical protein
MILYFKVSYFSSSARRIKMFAMRLKIYIAELLASYRGDYSIIRVFYANIVFFIYNIIFLQRKPNCYFYIY